MIIPTLNRTDFVKKTVSQLLNQVFDKSFEILVVDQSDNEDPELARDSSVRYFHVTSFRGLPEARNFGWQHARCDFVLYLDDDIEIDSDLLNEHYKMITQPQYGIVAGGITEKNNANPSVKKVGYFNYYTATPSRGFNMSRNGLVHHAPGGNISIKRRVLEQVGGFDEQLNVGAALYEETDLCLRATAAGYQIFFNHDAHVVHLAAKAGGCRVADIREYLSFFAHNRGIIISRHLNAVQRLTAFGYLLKMVMAYSVSYRRNLFGCFLTAYRQGFSKGKLAPRCGNYV